MPLPLELINKIVYGYGVGAMIHPIASLMKTYNLVDVGDQFCQNARRRARRRALDEDDDMDAELVALRSSLPVSMYMPSLNELVYSFNYKRVDGNVVRLPRSLLDGGNLHMGPPPPHQERDQRGTLYVVKSVWSEEHGEWVEWNGGGVSWD